MGDGPFFEGFFFEGESLLLEIIETEEQDIAQDNKNISLVSVRLISSNTGFGFQGDE